MTKEQEEKIEKALNLALAVVGSSGDTTDKRKVIELVLEQPFGKKLLAEYARERGNMAECGLIDSVVGHTLCRYLVMREKS